MVVTSYHKWIEEIKVEQDKFYRRVAVILFIVAMIATAIGLWGLLE